MDLKRNPSMMNYKPEKKFMNLSLKNLSITISSAIKEASKEQLST